MADVKGRALNVDLMQAHLPGQTVGRFHGPAAGLRVLSARFGTVSDQRKDVSRPVTIITTSTYCTIHEYELNSF